MAPVCALVACEKRGGSADSAASVLLLFPHSQPTGFVETRAPLEDAQMCSGSLPVVLEVSPSPLPGPTGRWALPAPLLTLPAGFFIWGFRADCVQ